LLYIWDTREGRGNDKRDIQELNRCFRGERGKKEKREGESFGLLDKRGEGGMPVENRKRREGRKKRGEVPEASRRRKKRKKGGGSPEGKGPRRRPHCTKGDTILGLITPSGRKKADEKKRIGSSLHCPTEQKEREKGGEGEERLCMLPGALSTPIACRVVVR